ncbi:MAG TPA: PQQ-binding-like beta-propeller repeat protein [Ktedonobacterales bacterium]|nr:PQQ-binding-like beta-propeller repeat protein [Ktedonobacterales bacterium]
MEPEEEQGTTPPTEEAPADASSAALSAPVATLPTPGRARRIRPWALVIAGALVVVLIATTLIVVHQTANSTNTGTSAASVPSGLSIYGLTQPVAPLGNPLPFDNARAATAQGDSGSVFALNAADGRLRWDYKTSDGVEDGQIVANGVLYTGSSNGSVYAFDAGTGKVLWSVKLLEQSVVGQVVDGVVYAWSSAGAENSQGNVYALDARSGKQLWQFANGGGVDLVADGTVYVGSAGDPSQTAGTIYALNASTGAERWHFQGQGSLSTQRAADGQVYVIGLQAVDPSDTNLFGFQATLSVLDASTGTLRWSYPKQPDGNLSLVDVENGMVYLYITNSSAEANISDSLVALNATDGALRWETGFSLVAFPAGSGTTTSSFLIGGLPPALLSDGAIYVGSQNDPIAAYNASTGAPLWSNLQLESDTGQGLTLDMVADGVVYLDAVGESASLGLYALDAHTGRLLWKRLGKFLTVGAVVDGVVYAASVDMGPPFTPKADDNSVVALDATTGAVRWSYSLGQETANITVQ